MLGFISDLVPVLLLEEVIGWFVKRKKVCIVVAATVAVLGVKRFIFSLKYATLRKIWSEVGKDVVVLHLSPYRTRSLPCISPYALKLETYLKLADISYKVDTCEPSGPNGMVPWITYNGEHIEGSQVIIEYLNEKFRKDLDADLTLEQKCVGHTMRIMLENHFFWCWSVRLFCVDTLYFKGTGPLTRLRNSIMVPLIQRKIKKEASTVGIGLYSPEVIEEMGKKDLRTISSYLGDNQFLMGDKPTEVDCTIFAFLANVLWPRPSQPNRKSPYVKLIKEEFGNLSSYYDRMAQTVWSDWKLPLAESILE